jgi:hypothetical protein
MSLAIYGKTRTGQRSLSYSLMVEWGPKIRGGALIRFLEQGKKCILAPRPPLLWIFAGFISPHKVTGRLFVSLVVQDLIRPHDPWRRRQGALWLNGGKLDA